MNFYGNSFQMIVLGGAGTVNTLQPISDYFLTKTTSYLCFNKNLSIYLSRIFEHLRM